MKKKLLMITWRDIKSPFTGGAENLTHGILKQLRKKYTITVLTSAFPHCKIKENIDGIQYIRLGSRQFNYVGVYNWRVYFSVLRYWFLHIRNKQNYDVVIEQINNIPFLYPLYGGKKTIIYINQLCRINWFYQVPLMLSCIGFLIFEPLYLWLLRKQKVITISKSSKNDLVRFGFDKKNIHIIHVGIEFKPVTSLDRIKKFKHFSILSIGNIRSMKRTHDQIEAF
ncbi:glycosyltransferase, partial [Candidatus Woesebacteria bacterium]|nr:glycosyltransferase [Candidatus Woesebacteria bacterium]